MNTVLLKKQTQYITAGDKKISAVIPYELYLNIISKIEEKEEKNRIPPEDSTPIQVVEDVIMKDENPITAWRKYLKISQVELARRLGLTQGAISAIEKNTKNKKVILQRIANSLGISLNQLKI